MKGERWWFIEDLEYTVSEFNEFEPSLKSAKNWFYLSASQNIEYNFKWNQPYLSRVLNLSRGSNSLNATFV